MSFTQSDDVRIHYELSGPTDAPVLVFSNSLGENLTMWDAQMTRFQALFRVLRYDTRGHGQSSVTPGPYTIQQLARDLTCLLDGLCIDLVHFCGLSMGGQIGMWLALNDPVRLKKLVLCNTAAKIGTHEMWNSRIDTVRENGMKSISTAVIDRWFSPQFRAKSPAAVASTKLMLENTNPEGYVANCLALRDFDARETVAAVQVPTLVIAGTNDTATTPADGRYLADRISGARYVELNAAHLSNIEETELFNREVSSFLLS